jgi:Zn-dependent protease with chaperone function
MANDETYVDVIFSFHSRFLRAYQLWICALGVFVLIGAWLKTSSSWSTAFVGTIVEGVPQLVGVATILWIVSSRDYENVLAAFHQHHHAVAGRRCEIVQSGLQIPQARSTLGPWIALTSLFLVTELPGDDTGVLLPLAALLALLILVMAGPLSGRDTDPSDQSGIPFDLMVGTTFLFYVLASLGVWAFLIPIAEGRASRSSLWFVAVAAITLFATPTLQAIRTVRRAERLLERLTTRQSVAVARVITHQQERARRWRTSTAALFCLLLGLANILGLIVAMQCAVFALTGRDAYLGVSVSSPVVSLFGPSMARVLGGLFALPFVVVGGVVSIHRIRRAISLRRRLKCPAPSTISAIIGGVSSTTQMSHLRIAYSAAQQQSITATWWFGPVVEVSGDVLEGLNESECEAVVSHEIYHAKHHSVAVVAGRMLSHLAMCGQGLVMSLVNTRELEYAADAYAVGYLRSTGRRSDVLVSAITKLHIKQMRAIDFSGATNLPTLSDLRQGGSVRSVINQLKVIIAVHCGDLVIAYHHPTLEQRIREIQNVGGA